MVTHLLSSAQSNTYFPNGIEFWGGEVDVFGGEFTHLFEKLVGPLVIDVTV